ncbi:winged helix-turn-helix transcriptional regulator, partial [Salinispora arenicola]|uniref:winged helix-turn-helix transcriptional regulator n=1 Tax=Salinispora arenicola TaxID=168697 RepID=UPI0027DD5BC8
METNGLVQRRVAPRPASGVVYELTDYGTELEPILLSLGGLGRSRCGNPPRARSSLPTHSSSRCGPRSGRGPRPRGWVSLRTA